MAHVIIYYLRVTYFSLFTPFLLFHYAARQRYDSTSPSRRPIIDTLMLRLPRLATLLQTEFHILPDSYMLPAYCIVDYAGCLRLLPLLLHR